MKELPLQAQFVEEITALEESGAGMPFIFKPSEAFMLLSILQLALRHPAMAQTSPTVAEFARALAENIQERLCKTPAMKEIAERGWQQEHDIP
jgi:hypothetical protein